jgi:hypothetical protein
MKGKPEWPSDEKYEFSDHDKEYYDERLSIFKQVILDCLTLITQIKLIVKPKQMFDAPLNEKLALKIE